MGIGVDTGSAGHSGHWHVGQAGHSRVGLSEHVLPAGITGGHGIGVHLWMRMMIKAMLVSSEMLRCSRTSPAVGM